LAIGVDGLGHPPPALVEAARQQVIKASLLRIEAGKFDLVEEPLGGPHVVAFDASPSRGEIELVAHPLRVVRGHAVGLHRIVACALEVMGIGAGNGPPQQRIDFLAHRVGIENG
jgi:hypothetical protein